MLNYIWAGLIIFSLIFALATDIQELSENRFRNDVPLPVEVDFPEGYDEQARRQPIRVQIDSAQYADFYNTPAQLDSSYEGTLVQTEDGIQVQFGEGMDLPEPLGVIQTFNEDEEGDPLRSKAVGGNFRFTTPDSTVAQAGLTFNEVRFRKLRDIAQGALDFAETAAEIAIGLIGVLALFLGLLQIADAAGLIYSLTNLVQPILRPLFPEVPDGHPAMAMISLNLLANVFGLGNAATPLGIKAMEELQAMNPSEETATDSMVMLLALNTSSVQLVPPVLLVAIMGLQINQLVFSITLATLCSTIVGASAAYLLSRTRWYRDSSPVRQAGDVARDSSGQPLTAESEEADLPTRED